ncbi:MAG: RHS repeat-associated core domain-containing protein [Bacteroidota bacterium]
MKIKAILTICLLAGFCSFAFCGTITEVETLHNGCITSGNPTMIALGSELEITDDHYGIAVDPVEPDFVVNRELVVALVYGREARTDVAGSAWSLEVDYKLEHADANGLTETGTLSIRHFAVNDDGVYEALQVFKGLSGKAKLTITRVKAYNANENPDTYLNDPLTGCITPEDIRLELRQTTEVYHFLDPATQISPVTNNYDGNSHLTVLSWPYLEGAEAYEVEWAFIDGQTIVPPTTDDAIFENSVRIRTSQTHYHIDVLYPAGDLYYRVRPVGRFIRGVGDDYSHLKFGAWSNKVSDIGITGFESDMNWQYNAVYAEEGKNKKVVSYFDEGLKNRQVQTRLSTEETTVVGESKYDYHGRSTVQIVPVPAAPGNNDLFFKPEFNSPLSDVNLAYSSKHFDKSTSQIDREPEALHDDPTNSEGAGNYFSPSNPRDNLYTNLIPDAEGYPLTQVEYTLDGTGRPRYQGGVGEFYQIYDQVDLRGRATRYYYGSASETELRRLFGSNVGDASHYDKNLVVDPNGQVSFSYLDQTGRVVATALAGSSPDNVVQLDNYDNYDITINLDEENDIDRENLVSRTQTVILCPEDAIPPSQGIEYNFTYELTGVDDVYAGTGTLVCGSCKYELRIWITDSENEPILLDFTNQSGSSVTEEELNWMYEPSNACSSGQYDGGTVTFSAFFPQIGEYTVTKELRLLEGNISDLWSELDQGELTTIQTQLEQTYTNNIDYSGCDLTCEQICERDLVNPTQQQLDDCIAQCQQDDFDDLMDELENGEYNHCDITRFQIWLQVGPGGWLFESDEFLYNNISLLTNEGVVFQGSGQTALAAEIRDEWQQEWAGYLESAHREYCHYQWCIESATIESYVFDLEMAQQKVFWESAGITTFWAQALTDGYRDANDDIDNVLDKDPYFYDQSTGTVPNPVARTEMFNLMTNYHIDGATTYSVFDFLAIADFEFTQLTGYDGENRWDVYVGIYQSLKKQSQVYELEQEGCEFYDDEHTIVPKPVMQGTWDNEQDFIENGIEVTAQHCGETCYGSVEYWLTKLVDVCPALGTPGNASDYEEIRQLLNQYCMESCMSLENPLGVITQAAIDASLGTGNLLDQVNDILEATTYASCTYDIVDENGNIVTTSIGISTLSTDVVYTFDTFNHPGQVGCPPCEILADHISEGEWIPAAFDNNGVVIDADWVPGYWNVTALEGLLGLNYALNPLTVAEQIDWCINNGYAASFPNINLGYNDVVMDDDNPLPATELDPVENYLVNLLGCNSALSHNGNLWTGNEPFIEDQGDCLCSTLDNYIEEDNMVYTFNVANFNSDFNLNLTLQQVSNLVNAIPINSSTCEFWRGDNFLTSTTEPTIDWSTLFCDEDGVAVVSITSGFEVTTDWAEVLQTECEELLEQQALQEAQDAYFEQVNAILEEHFELKVERCFDNPFEENFHYTFNNKEYHYTLYYYDQAGNLVQTVPPEGVEPLSLNGPSFDASGKYISGDPDHRLKTRYRYNTLGQVVWQYSPDGGNTVFYYDKLQRLRLSQNAQQAIDGHFSYTKYDNQSRIVEVGQVEDYTIPTGQGLFEEDLNTLSFPDDNYLLTDITSTYYDEPLAGSAIAQNNLRGRVAHTSNDAISTVYSYDVHGNVNHMRHQVEELGDFDIEYDYDLVSGNVNEVIYQKDKIDEFRHRYDYDADNRITHVWTSEKGYIWDLDARYFYYLHGPLARIELGHDKVQGLDYYYTLQGWIKGVNRPAMPGGEADADLGLDGSILGTSNNQWFGRDEFGYQLGYHSEDFQAIGTLPNNPLLDDPWVNLGPQILDLGTNQGLFNGNIAYMVTGVPEFPRQNLDETTSVQAFAYQYDQLHRIKQAKSAHSEWRAAGDADFSINGDNDIFYSFDGNGNLNTLKRYSQGTFIDDFTYHYPEDANGLVQNQLQYVGDNQTGTWTGDLPVQNSGNYIYDAIGNLVEDTSEEVQSIDWNVYGKVDKVTYTSQGITNGRNNINFSYDANGNRLRKNLEDNDETTTWYIRDASGNIMSTYKSAGTTTGLYYDYKLFQEEVPLYGSSRLGLNRYEQKQTGGYVEIDPSQAPGDDIKIANLMEKVKYLRMAEVGYDSPETEDADVTNPSPQESHLGEFIAIYNGSTLTQNLEGVQLRNLTNGLQTVLFTNQQELNPGQTMIVAYGAPSDKALFLELNNLEDWIASEEALGRIHWYWQTSMPLTDEESTIVLEYISPETSGQTAGVETFIDVVEYASTTYQVSNKHYDTGNPAEARYSVMALQKDPVTLVLNEVWPAPDVTKIIGDALKDFLELSQPKAFRDSVITAQRIIEFDKAVSKISPDPSTGSGGSGSYVLYNRERGDKVFELSNHLSNVIVTLNDILSGKPDGTNPDIAEYYYAGVQAANDYYPFGMQMPGRKYNSGDYRFGFNGKEQDQEWGSQGYNDFGARIYNPSLGRWMSVDPELELYPDHSPYGFALENPVKLIDIDGGVVTDENGNVIVTITDPTATWRNQGGLQYNPTTGLYEQAGFYTKKGKILADDGSEIMVHIPQSRDVYIKRYALVGVDAAGNGILSAQIGSDLYVPGVDATYNCIGDCIADGMAALVIDSDIEVDQDFLDSEGYIPVLTANAKKGDIGLYTNSRNKTQHGERFLSPTTVHSKGGVVDPATVVPTPPGTDPSFASWTDYQVYSKTFPDTKVDNLHTDGNNTKTSRGLTIISGDTFDHIKRLVSNTPTNGSQGKEISLPTGKDAGGRGIDNIPEHY